MSWEPVLPVLCSWLCTTCSSRNRLYIDVSGGTPELLLGSVEPQDSSGILWACRSCRLGLSRGLLLQAASRKSQRTLAPEISAFSSPQKRDSNFSYLFTVCSSPQQENPRLNQQICYFCFMHLLHRLSVPQGSTCSLRYIQRGAQQLALGSSSECECTDPFWNRCEKSGRRCLCRIHMSCAVIFWTRHIDPIIWPMSRAKLLNLSDWALCFDRKF